MNLMRAMTTVGGLTLGSRVLGFVRDMLAAALMGAGPVADAFFVALRLPNLFRRMFAEGAFAAAFVPQYSKRLEQNGGVAIAGDYAGRAMALLLAVLAPLVAIFMICMPWVIHALAPGFDEGGGERYDLAVELTRITFPYLIFMSVTALIGGMLNAVGRFGPFAAAPVLFNITLITALLASIHMFETPGHALAWGVSAAGVIQLLWILWHMKRHRLFLPLRKPKLDPEMRKLWKLILPGALGAGVVQINLMVDTILASTLDVGAVTWLYFADRLNQLPLGVIGIAIGTALLPMLSRLIESGDKDGTKAAFSRALEYALLLGLPAAAGLVLLAEPLISTLFERGAFDADAVARTAPALMSYAIGLPGYILVKVLATALFAREDTVSPVKVGITITVLNICLSLTLIGPLGHIGIALSTGLTAWLHVGLLGWKVHKAGGLTLDHRVKRRIPGLLIATAVMAAALYWVTPQVAPLLEETWHIHIPALFTLIASGALLYFGTAGLLGAFDPMEIRSLRSRPK
ncbi:MAG: murein biosynthesis integral membrane protein MurJ [Alphaproteobacteria bacterium]